MQNAPAFSLLALRLVPNKIITLSNETFNNKNKTSVTIWLKFILLPFIVILVLMKLYALSNTYFESSINSAFNTIGEWFSFVSIGRVALLFFGVIIGTFILIKLDLHKWALHDEKLQMSFTRIKGKNKFLVGLSKQLFRQYQVAITLFLLLNIMIAWINFLDVKHIWIDFKWDGGFLKDMVHQGTYLLVIAILISMAISLQYLNSNLVFIKGSKTLQVLIIIWLLQNLIMVVSVAIRNTYYIQYFALANKRIFVYFFLASCIIGIVSIILKTLHFKSFGYLLSVNSVSIYLIFLSATLFNWDVIIAKYNFNHYKESFVHYDFLKDLNESALPYLVTDKMILQEIDDFQSGSFAFSSREEYKKINYPEFVESRKKYFKACWNEQNWLDWNWPEAKAYELLNK